MTNMNLFIYLTGVLLILIGGFFIYFSGLKNGENKYRVVDSDDTYQTTLKDGSVVKYNYGKIDELIFEYREKNL